MLLETDFIVGQDDFADLIINPTAYDSFYFFFNQRDNRLVKRFVLDRTHPNVLYGCEVTLIKKNDKFTPRLHFTVKDQTGKFKRVRAEKNEETIHLKASKTGDRRKVSLHFSSLINSGGNIRAVPDFRMRHPPRKPLGSEFPVIWITTPVR